MSAKMKSMDSQKFSVTLSPDNAVRLRAKSARTRIPMSELIDSAMGIVLDYWDTIEGVTHESQ